MENPLQHCNMPQGIIDQLVSAAETFHALLPGGRDIHDNINLVSAGTAELGRASGV